MGNYSKKQDCKVVLLNPTNPFVQFVVINY